jgi:hypothetical protein
MVLVAPRGSHIPVLLVLRHNSALFFQAKASARKIPENLTEAPLTRTIFSDYSTDCGAVAPHVDFQRNLNEEEYRD